MASDGGGGQATEGDGGNAQGGSGSGRGQQSAPNFDQMLDSQSISLDMDEGEGGGGGDAALSARQRPTQISLAALILCMLGLLVADCTEARAWCRRWRESVRWLRR